MFEYMDSIVNALESVGEAATEAIKETAAFILLLLLKTLILFTTPLWICPYMRWRSKREGEQGDAENGNGSKTR